MLALVYHLFSVFDIKDDIKYNKMNYTIMTN